MKQKLFASIATGIIIVSGVITPLFGLLLNTFNPSVAYAQIDGGGATTFDEETPSTSTTTTTSVGETTTTYTAPETESVPPPDNIGNDSASLNCGANLLCALVQFVGIVFTFTSNLIATVSGLISDFALWFSMQSNSYGIINPFLENGWKLVRDITNLLFIFALFVVGFVLIFDVSADSQSSVRLNPTRTIAYVIIMALLVNFSFFITRTVIEVGNVTGMFIYSSIAGAGVDVADESVAGQNQQIQSVGSPSTWFTSNTFPGMKSVSLGILNKVNPQQLILDNSTIKSSGNFLWSSYDWSFYVLYIFLAIMSAIFNLMLTYIFITIAFLFLGRYVGLSFLIIFSPLAFVSKTIPVLENKEYIGFTDWISELVGLTFVAPIYLIFVYLTIMFLNANVFGADFTGSYILLATVVTIKLILVSFVLLRGKSLAVSMSGHIGKMAGGLIDKVAIAGVGLATAGTGMLAAQTLGRVGGAIAKNGSLQRVATTGSKSVQDAQKWIGSRIRKLGVSNYRLGNTKLGNKIATGIEKSQISQRAATGVRTMSKSFATINPYDIGVGGMTGRKGLAALANNTGYSYKDKDGNIVNVDNKALAQGLANDFVNNPVTGIKKTTALNRMFDIEASKNAKKTLTNTIDGAMTAGLNSGNQGGGGTGTATSGPVTVTGPNTGPIPNPTGWSGAKGPVPGVKLPNDFNGVKLATGASTPAPEQTNTAQKEESEKLAGLYDRNKQAQGGSMNVENLVVKNLTVENGGQQKHSGLVDQYGAPISSGGTGTTAERPQDKATTLLTGIHSTPKTEAGAINYNPADFVEPSSKPVLVDQYSKPISSVTSPEFEKYKTQEDINIQNEIDNLNDPDGSKRVKEKANKEYWDNYENTVMGMNEHIGYNPVSAEKYKAQLEKELSEKGVSKEEIEGEWQKIKNHPHASWI